MMPRRTMTAPPASGLAESVRPGWVALGSRSTEIRRLAAGVELLSPRAKDSLPVAPREVDRSRGPR
jgi:hypothetical protein